MLFEIPKVFGLILDLSLREAETGYRLFEEVRRQLHEVILLMDEDGMYLYHPEVFDVLYKRGEKISTLANFETDGFKFDLTNAIKQTLFILCGEDEDSSKTILVITDRFGEENKFGIRKFLSMNEKDYLGCRLCVIGIGNRYNRKALESMGGFHLFHSDTSVISDLLMPIFEDSNGNSKNSCG